MTPIARALLVTMLVGTTPVLADGPPVTAQPAVKEQAAPAAVRPVADPEQLEAAKPVGVAIANAKLDADMPGGGGAPDSALAWEFGIVFAVVAVAGYGYVAFASEH